MQEAQSLAQKKGNQQLDVEHLLLAILNDDEGIGTQILNRIGGDIEALKADLDKEIDKFPKVSGATPNGTALYRAAAKGGARKVVRRGAAFDGRIH